MSLRPWSDDVLLALLAEDFGGAIAHLHVKGEPVPARPRVPPRMARRHDMSFAHVEGDTDRDIATWLEWSRGTASRGAPPVLSRDGKVAAVFWIALLGAERQPSPTIDPALVAAVAALNARIRIENDTKVGLDTPAKVWLGTGRETRG